MRNTCKQTVLNTQRILFIYIYISILEKGVIGKISEDNDGKNHSVTIGTNYHVKLDQDVFQTTLVNDSSTSPGIIVSYDPLDGFEKQKANDVNLAFLPSFALILFIVLICLRICVWYREEFKYKSRGCSYDITSYVILSQGDDKFRNIDIKSDTNSYDTFNSITSFLRRNPQIHDTIHSTGSLQNRIDAKIYETVRSYTPILKKVHQNNETELLPIPAGKRSRKTSLPNSYTVSLEAKEVRIKDTRFRVVPALDNHWKHVSMRNSFKYRNRTSSQNEEGSQIKPDQIDEQPRLVPNSEPGSPKSDLSKQTNKKIMVDAETQITTPPKRRRTSSRKRRRFKDSSSVASSFESTSLGDSISRIDAGDSLSSTSNSNSVNQQESYVQINGKNKFMLADQQMHYDECPNVKASSTCDSENTDSQNVVFVTAMVHNQLTNDGHRDEATQTNVGNSKPVAGNTCSDANDTNGEKFNPLNINGLVNKPHLRSALSYPSIVSNVFVKSTNGNNNRTNGYIKRHRYYSWNSGLSHKNVCTCLSTNSASKDREMSKVQSSTCMVCYFNHNYAQNSLKFNDSEIDNIVCEQKENRNENQKNSEVILQIEDCGCLKQNGVVSETNFVL